VSPIRKAVITAAGRGTRQYPASTAVQKEMFPLVDTDGLTKPVIQIIGEEALAAGVEELCIVTPPGGEELYRHYFRRMDEGLLAALRGKEWAMLESERLQDFGERLTFVTQDRPDGYGHAVHQARDFVGDEPFLLMLGDHVYVQSRAGGPNCATQLIEQHLARGLAATSAVQPTPEERLHLHGTVRGEPIEEGAWRVTAMHEKPDPAFARAHLRTPGLPPGQYLCFFGMNVFPPAIFDVLQWHIDHDVRQGGEIQLTPSQELLRQRLPDGAYGACAIEGQRFDTGIPYGTMETQIALALAGKHRAEIVEAIARLLAGQLRGLSRQGG
jgi:UTP--glucose-1-phosphate uridylyltransferase